jgi:glutaryl-CoA dehydrogenase
MITNFKDMGDHYLLNGAKCGFPMHHLTLSLVWAKDEGKNSWTYCRTNGRFSTLKHNKWLVFFNWRIDFDKRKSTQRKLVTKSGLSAPLV